MLTELTNIEKFTRLGTLNLDSNFLTEATKFPQLPNLHTLTLNKNRISDIDLLYVAVTIIFDSARLVRY